MQRAVEEGRRDVENNPRGTMQRTNLALYEAYAGNFQNAVKEAQEVLKRNPKSVSALGALALGHLGDGKAADTIVVYEKMRSLSARGASSSATGLADVALWEGRLKDARDILDKGIASDEAAKNADAGAIKLNYLAYLYLTEGDGKRAVAAAEKALTSSRDPVILYGAGHIAAEAGQRGKAVNLSSELISKPSSDFQSYADLLLGEADLKNGDATNALNKFKEANAWQTPGWRVSISAARIWRWELFPRRPRSLTFASSVEGKQPRFFWMMCPAITSMRRFFTTRASARGTQER